MTDLQGAQRPEGKAPSNEVTDIPVQPTTIRSNTPDFFRNNKRIQPLHVCPGKNRLEVASKARAEDILALVGTRSGMRKVYVVVARYPEGHKGSNGERMGAQVVSQVQTDILKVAMVLPVVNRKLMRLRTVVLGKHKRNTHIQGQLVSNYVIDILEPNKCRDITVVDSLPIGKEMVLDKIVLQG